VISIYAIFFPGAPIDLPSQSRALINKQHVWGCYSSCSWRPCLVWVLSLCLTLRLTLSTAVSSIQILRQIETSESLLKFQARRSSHVYMFAGSHANG